MADAIKHERTPQPVCPHCGHVIRDVWDYDGIYDEDVTTELDCPDCEEPFTSRCRTTYSFTTEPA